MSAKIKLKVPAKPDADYISQGNHSVECEPGSTVEVENPRFAEWLVREKGFETVNDSEESTTPAEAATQAVQAGSSEKKTGGKK